MKDKFLAEWVSVEERLPRHGDEVLIKDESYAANLDVGTFNVKNMCWAVKGSFYYKPTHWLELLPITEN